MHPLPELHLTRPVTSAPPQEDPIRSPCLPQSVASQNHIPFLQSFHLSLKYHPHFNQNTLSSDYKPQEHRHHAMMLLLSAIVCTRWQRGPQEVLAKRTNEPEILTHCNFPVEMTTSLPWAPQILVGIPAQNLDYAVRTRYRYTPPCWTVSSLWIRSFFISNPGTQQMLSNYLMIAGLTP